MSESIEIGSVQHAGTITTILVEESKQFRRVVISRRRLVFQEEREVGRVHIYVDEIANFIDLLGKANKLVERIARDGWEEVFNGNSGRELHSLEENSKGEVSSQEAE